jgi:pimeloyl-ACP methyl ester carboxylesterase
VSDGIPHVTGVDHEFVDAGGLRTHVALAGDGPPVVLLHGWPQHWYLWRDVIPLVAPHARVIAPDFRGFGWTEVPEEGYEKTQLARDVLALLDELGIDEFTVAGHDWGGYVGFLLAMEHPDRVRGVLAANILPPWPPRDRRVALDSWRFLYQPVLGTPHAGRRAGRAIARRGLAEAGLSTADVDAFVSRLEGERGVASERLYRTFFFRELPGIVRGRYSPVALRTQTRLVFGQRDPILTTHGVEDVTGQSDRIELELVADATHFVVDEKPELIADRLLRLLASPVTG